MHPLHAVTLKYLQDLQKQHAQSNNSPELSYREYLGAFLRGATQALGKDANFTHEARLTKYGRPDYVVSHELTQIGGVEAEAWNTDLAHLAGHAKEQNERFRENLPNFLQTNHFHFRLFANKGLVLEARLPVPDATGKITVSDAVLNDMQAVLERFLDTALPAAQSAEAIAGQLAHRAALLREAAQTMLADPESELEPLYALYKQTLFADIERDKFADVYAQTFTYGLFLAWLSTDAMPFTRAVALSAIPKAVPPIRVMLQFGGGDDLPAPFEWIVDGICTDLGSADKEAATKHKASIADPLTAFYETFLQAYDPTLRERAGVYYTPDAVVDFLVRAVDDLLQTHFAKPEGLADPGVRLLDPATGTATFLARAYRQVHDTMTERGDGGLWPGRAQSHVAKHFNGFERLPAAYTLAHVKLRQQLELLGIPLADIPRLPVYLADTMMNHVPEQIPFPGADILSKEIRAAAHVRNEENILVILGNPPYFGKSDNPHEHTVHYPAGATYQVRVNIGGGKKVVVQRVAGRGGATVKVPTFIGELMNDYFEVDGNPLGEIQSKWLQNDYVKFIRFAQWRVERTGQGVVAFITDNSYLDNPTFRGMRRSLMQTFDEIYILDLHGSIKKKDRSPDGSEDKNVFDIQQGVAIAIFIKGGTANPAAGNPLIHHADVYGKRQVKYDFLLDNDLQSVEWQTLLPDLPSYLFRPQEQLYRQEYEAWDKTTDVFPVNGVGMQTGNDALTIHFSEDELWDTIVDFATLPLEEARAKYKLGPDTNERKLATAQNELLASGVLSSKGQAYAKRVLYRPFDIRYTYYTGESRGFISRPQRRVMGNIAAGPNMALIIGRSGAAIGGGEWDIVMVTNNLVDLNIYRRGGGQLHPLWLYPTSTEAAMGIQKQPNLAPAFMEQLTDTLGAPPAPETVFHYAYAIFHAPTYRTRYAAFLKTDFPRLPLPPNADAFTTLAALGKTLVALHLLEDPALAQHGITFPAPGTRIVQKRKDAARYTPPTATAPGRIHLNDTEYFDNVSQTAWDFQVGGYRPAAKWLADREGRPLTDDDINHYRRTLAALARTAALLPALDAAFCAAFLATAPPP